MPDLHETPHGHSKPPEPRAIGEPIPIAPDEGMSVGNVAAEILENRYFRVLALLENHGFNQTEGDDLPPGNSWFSNSLWPTCVHTPNGCYLESNFSPAKIVPKINRETRVLEDFRVKMQKENPVVPGKTMTVERPIALWDLVLNYRPNKDCGWAEIVAELKNLAIVEQALAAKAGVARAIENEQLRQAHESRQNPHKALAAGIAEGVAMALSTLGIQPKVAK